MTKQEKDILNLTGELWNKFLALPVMHDDDVPDVRHHIHAIQNIIYARDGMRSIDAELDNEIKSMEWFSPNIRVEILGAETEK